MSDYGHDEAMGGALAPLYVCTKCGWTGAEAAILREGPFAVCGREGCGYLVRDIHAAHRADRDRADRAEADLLALRLSTELLVAECDRIEAERPGALWLNTLRHSAAAARAVLERTKA